jgi:NADH:ubiquinone oxidoreductase subunit 3 (subunit A)
MEGHYNPQMKFTANYVMQFLSFALLLGAVVFYVGWSIAYGDWYDIGLYSVSVILILFGILGMLLFHYKIKQEESGVA